MNTIYNFLNKENQLWKKINPSNKNKNSSEIIDKQVLKTKSKTNNEFIIKTFILSTKYWFYSKNEVIKGYIDLDFIGIEYCIKEKKISLFNNNKYFSIYFENIIIFKKWKKFLKNKGILNNFQRYFGIKEKIGEGGNADVYLANKIKNNKQYAVKIISKSNLAEEGFLNSLINEINILRKLNHQNITKYNSLFESVNSFYLVIEYCNSNTLKQFVEFKSSSKEKKMIINQILDGLIYMHSLNLIHRDLKPENILINKEKNGDLIVKLADFGLSNYLDQSFIFKKCGTPGFISPEILNYNENYEYNITKKVDIYPLGHLIHFIYTGLNIFEFNDLRELISKNKQNKFNINQKLDKNLQIIIKSCLTLDPEIRLELDYLKEIINNKIN